MLRETVLTAGEVGAEGPGAGGDRAALNTAGSQREALNEY